MDALEEQIIQNRIGANPDTIYVGSTLVTSDRTLYFIEPTVNKDLSTFIEDIAKEIRTQTNKSVTIKLDNEGQVHSITVED